MTGDATKNSDIFISYSSKDRGRIAPLVEALEGVGWAVWWDRKIPVGKTYNEVIEAALNSCGCVIVVWSENSIESEYVRDETSEAKSQHKLVPVLIDQVKPPLEFRRIQAANLLNWAPEAESAEFDELLDAITDMIGKPESTRDSLDQAEVGDEDEDVDDDEDDDDDEDEDEDEDELESDDWFDKGYEAQERNQHKKALRCYTRAIDLDPDSAETYCNRGNAYDSLMRYGDALKDYRKAIRLDPNDADIYLNRGNTYSTLERFEEALEDYSAALKLEPDDAYVYGQRGFVLHRLERYEEALRDYDMALKLAPDDANTFHHNRGDAFFELGRYDAALREFGAAIEIDPEDLSTLQGLAEVCIIVGRYDDAFGYAKKAQALSLEHKDSSISLYLGCIARKLLGQDTEETSGRFNELLQKEFQIDWSFKKIDDWVKTAELSDDVREFIVAKTALLKTKQKKKE